MKTEDLTAIFQRNVYVINRQVEGLGHAESMLQLPFRGNCMNWVVGHLVESRDTILKRLGGEPLLTAEEAALYAFDSEPLTDTTKAVAFETLLAHIQESQVRLDQGFSTVSPEALAAYTDEEQKNTVADQIDFLAWHDTYHVGQLEYLRQLTGVNDKIF